MTDESPAAATPLRLHLKRDEKLEIDWQDGRRCVYPVAYLRAMCPCAACKQVRDGAAGGPRTRLNILPGNYAAPVQALHGELVGGYALKIEWSDQHDSGIYSFQYLRQICPPAEGRGPA